MNLILFTNSYPYIRGGEQNFLDMEVGCLTHSFDKIFLVPFEKKEKKMYGGHLKASVEDGYSLLFHSQNTFSLFLRALSSPLLIKGLLEKNYPLFSFHAPFLRILFSHFHFALHSFFQFHSGGENEAVAGAGRRGGALGHWVSPALLQGLFASREGGQR